MQGSGERQTLSNTVPGSYGQCYEGIERAELENTWRYGGGGFTSDQCSGALSKDLTLQLRPIRKDIVSNWKSLWEQFVFRPCDPEEVPVLKQMREN